MKGFYYIEKILYKVKFLPHRKNLAKININVLKVKPGRI